MTTFTTKQIEALLSLSSISPVPLFKGVYLKARAIGEYIVTINDVPTALLGSVEDVEDFFAETNHDSFLEIIENL